MTDERLNNAFQEYTGYEFDKERYAEIEQNIDSISFCRQLDPAEQTYKDFSAGYEAGQQSVACCGACAQWLVYAVWPTGENTKQFCKYHNDERMYDDICKHFEPRRKELRI